MVRFGNNTLHVIETGTFGLDGGAMFGVVPRPLWERRMKPDERNRIKLSMRCLLIEREDRLILIDNGVGDKYEPKFAGLYNIDHETNTLDRSLKSAGFSRDQVTDIVLTHLHFDHAGGSTRLKDDTATIAFPNAIFHVQRDHWVAANAPNAREKASFFEENLAPLAASGQLNLINGPQSLWDGISLETYNGHTDCMQTVTIKNDLQSLIFTADLLPTSHHLAPAWTMGYDVRPLQTMTEKSKFLAEAIKNDSIIFFEHDPDVQIANIGLDDRGRPVVNNSRTLEEI